jgi:preprotein translocase subunit SecA
VAAESAPQEPVRPFKRDLAKVGRDDDCPCGSGQKNKKCHGAGAEPKS